MKQLKLEIDDQNKMINVPTEWNDVTVKQYSDILKIDDNKNNIAKRIEIMSILLGIDIDLVEYIDHEDFLMLENEIKFIYTDMELTVVDHIELEGEKYYLYTDFEKLTIGEQYSISIITDKANGNLLNVYNELLCLFLRKKKDNGKFEKFKAEHMDRISLFNNVPIAKVNQLLVFFSNGGK